MMALTKKSILLLFLLAAFPSYAQNFMLYGASRWDGAGAGTGAGLTDVLSAAYRNPAFLQAKFPVLSLGGMAVADSMLVNGARTTKWSGIEEMAFATPLPVFGLKNRLFLGLDLQVPGTTIYRIRAMPITQPQYLFLRSSAKRLNLAVSMAIRIIDGLYLGAGFTVLPQVDGYVTVDFTSSGQANSTQVDVKLRFAPVVGIAYRPLDWLSLGLTYHGGNHTPLAIPVTVKISDQIPDIYTSVDAQEMYAPHIISGGAAVILGKLTVAADLNYLIFSPMEQPSPDVSLMDSSGKVTKSSSVPSPGPRNVFNPCVAIGFTALPWLNLKTGYSYMPSVLKEQSGQTNLLDSPKHTVTLGMALDLDKLAKIPMGFVFSGGLTIYVKQTDEKAKPMTENPGYPSITYSGLSGHMGMDLWIRF